MLCNLDPHVHTVYSGDSIITLDHLRKALKGKLKWIGITDHNQIKGAIKARKIFGDRIIAGIELSTKEGHLVLLGFKDEQEARKFVNFVNHNIIEVIETACESNLLAIVVHPLERLRHGINYTVLRNLLERNFENLAIEIINSSSLPLGVLRRKRLQYLISRYNWRRLIAGSDAHIPQLIGYAYVILPSNNKDPLETLLKAEKIECRGRYSPLILKMLTAISQFNLKIRRISLSF